MAFFKSFTPRGKQLSECTIQDIIYTYASMLLRNDMLSFPKYESSFKEKIVNLVTDRFYEELQKLRFKDGYYLPWVNASWIMDIFNPLMEGKVNVQIMYAGASHIRQVITFLQELQKKMGDDTIVFQQEYPDRNQPLAKEMLKELLN
jgi:hypothetical protein